jgi:hypothetical protein
MDSKSTGRVKRALEETNNDGLGTTDGGCREVESIAACTGGRRMGKE